MRQIARVQGSHSWYRPCSPRPTLVKFLSNIFFFFFKFKSMLKISAKSHGKQMKYLDKKFAFRTYAQAIPAPWQEKKIWGPLFLTKISLKKVSPFYFTSPETIQVEILNRQTDRQTNSLTPYTGVFFFQLNLPPPYSLRSQGITCIIDNLF